MPHNSTAVFAVLAATALAGLSPAAALVYELPSELAKNHGPGAPHTSFTGGGRFWRHSGNSYFPASHLDTMSRGVGSSRPSGACSNGVYQLCGAPQ